MPDAGAFFSEAGGALRPGGRLLFAEPKWHVSGDAFARSLEAGERAGLTRQGDFVFPGTRAVLLARP